VTQSKSNGEIWILGATGRVGQNVAERLVKMTDFPLVLVGRDSEGLERIAQDVRGNVRILEATLETVANEIEHQEPGVVINTIGPFTRTASPIARACLPRGHYLDLANDVISLEQVLALAESASATSSTFVSGAGFGVLATEAIVMKLCEGRERPDRVRVDSIGSVEMVAGIVGSAYAGTTTEMLATGGRHYEKGQLVRARLGGDLQQLTLPDGDKVRTAGVPSGELTAAWKASGAPDVIATSALAPTSALVRALLPATGALVSIKAVRSFMDRTLAKARLKARPRPREYSWGHAVLEWSDGTAREGWLRTGDAMEFTVEVLAEVAVRLANGLGRPGAFTPGALFGADLATEVGGNFLLD